MGYRLASNLEALCKPHHRLKTHSTWQVTQTGGGVLAWTSPTGQQLSTDPGTAEPGSDWPDTPGGFDDHPAGHPGDPPARPEPDWLELDALPTDAETDAQLARYDAHADDICVPEDVQRPDAA